MNSTRLPGKILYPLPNGKTVIQSIVDTISKCERLNGVYVATPDEIPVNGSVYRWHGEENDVLGRYYGCASRYSIDPIIRITADCPLLTAETVDMVVSSYMDFGNREFVYNPNDGADVEVFSFSALENAHIHASDAYDREHVTPYIRRNSVLYPVSIEALGPSLDTEEDYYKICEIMRK